MSKALKGIFEWSMNILCIVALAYVGTVLWLQHAGTVTASAGASGLHIGQRLPVNDVDWKARHRTLVFILSTGCHFCSESASFYAELLKNQPQGDWQALAIFPQPSELATLYMRKNGYDIPNMRQVDLSALEIAGTPTLLLVDNTGVIRQQWIGKLSSKYEDDVARHLGILGLSHAQKQPSRGDSVTSSRTEPNLITRDDLKALLAHRKDVSLLDVRGRDRYSFGHLDGAINIPIDEVPARASHELRVDHPLILYCNYSAECQAKGQPSYCSLASEELHEDGFTDVRIVRDTLPLLSEAGLRVYGTPSEPPTTN